MNNYQLYRTNVSLSGQLKWDLILDARYNELYVSDFHLTPISNNTPYTYKTDEYIINNSHQDNVKEFYAENKGHFYKECIDSEFAHNWPIITESTGTTLYSNMYDMGCKRSKKYNNYKKQFEFLCPLWIEHLNGDLEFKIDIKNECSNTVFSSRILRLKPNVDLEYHTKFVEYFNSYITDAGLDAGSDDVMNISFKENTATITGLNVNNGIFETHNVSNLISNLTERERPLMEADHMLISEFAKNDLVAKQLINFNLCFNLEDIYSLNIAKMLYGESLIISVTVSINGIELDKKDFSTEYDYIDKLIKSELNTGIKRNVLSYLNDNQYVEFINKNKFCQNICHWSLAENNDYIFNVYDGFSGIYIDVIDDSIKVYENTHQYKDAPNTLLKKYDKDNNSGGWLNVYNVNQWNSFNRYITNTEIYKYNGTYIGKECNSFIHNLKYNYIPFFDKGIYLLGLNIAPKLMASIHDAYSDSLVQIFDNNKSIYMMYINDLVMILSTDINVFAFANFYEYLYKDSINEFSKYDDNTKSILVELYKMMASKIEPSLIILNKSLRYVNADSPILYTTEIEYVKDDITSNYVVRYDGKIKPTFTDKASTLYYKDYVTENNIKDSTYAIYNVLKFEPLYPSIDYCAIKKITEWDYETCPYVKVTGNNDNVFLYNNLYEYSWFNNNKCLVINPYIEFTYIKTKDDIKSVDEIITDRLREYYNTDVPELIQYIKGLYDCKNNWEYISLNNINDYIYHISLKLKNN